MWRRQPAGSSPIDTIVGRHTHVKGTLAGSGGIIRIDGRVEGDVETDGMAVLGEGGQVVGDIHAHDLIIGGTLIGNVTAAGHLELLPSGHLEGTVLVGAIIIGDGAVFDGVCHIVGGGTVSPPIPEIQGEPPAEQPLETAAQTAVPQPPADPTTDRITPAPAERLGVAPTPTAASDYSTHGEDISAVGRQGRRPPGEGDVEGAQALGGAPVQLEVPYGTAIRDSEDARSGFPLMPLLREGSPPDPARPGDDRGATG